jgi:hypothetical protein
MDACKRLEGRPAPPDDLVWYPQRAYSGRVYVPATAAGGEELELFGYVSFVQPEGGESGDFDSTVDFTDETAAQNPDWQIDLNDEVIGRWHGPGGTAGEVTLVWGRPLVSGAAIATAELDGETVDQCELDADGRFTLVALDAVTGFGPELYLEVALWDRRGRPLATESLYDE